MRQLDLRRKPSPLPEPTFPTSIIPPDILAELLDPRPRPAELLRAALVGLFLGEEEVVEADDLPFAGSRRGQRSGGDAADAGLAGAVVAGGARRRVEGEHAMGSEEHSS